MDPGTPLPSEDEAEAEAEAVVDGEHAATAEAAAEAASSSEVAVDAAAAAAAGAGAGDGAGPRLPAAEPEPVAVSTPAPDVPEAVGGPPLNGSAGRAATIWLELVSGEDGDDERASEPMEVLLREGLRPAVLERLAACLPPGRGSAVEALVAGAVCTFAKHGPLQLPQRPAEEAEEPGEGEPTAVNGTKAASAAAGAGEHGVGTNGKAAEGSAALPEAYCHGAAGLLTAPRDAPGLALTLGSAHQLDATHDVLGPVLLGRRVVQRLGALAPLVGGPAPARPLSVRAVPVEAPPGSDAADAAPSAPARPKTAPSSVPADSRPFLLEEAEEPSASEELELLGLDLDVREAEVQELKQQVFSRERQEGVAAVDGRLADAEQLLQRLVSGNEGREALEAQGLWLRERIRHLVRLIGKLK